LPLLAGQTSGGKIYFPKSNFLDQEIAMPEIRMRPKHQVTLPASIVRAANLQLDDKLEVSYINGNIIIAPKKINPQPSDVMAFAGVGSGLWGATPAAVENTVKKLRNDLTR
jgi:bifunctional DNA-binding transcriptional regulator/antitoxin component of YhaV-PrlF toxin-antitoxin module